MKKLFLLFISPLLLINCFAQGSWTQKADFPGQPRSNAVGFSIGNYAYMGTGYRWLSSMSVYFTDFWKYDPSSNSWSQIATFPGTTKVALASFSLDSVAYLGAGSSSPTSDLWKYSPVSNSWIKMSDIPKVLKGATGFSIGSYGYITVGSDTATSWFSYDLWQYDPSLNSWTQKAIFPGLGRSGSIGFSIGNYGYLGTGFDQNNQYASDFWKYDAINNNWIQIANFGGGNRGSSVAFVIDSFGYAGTGWKFPGGGQQDDLWRYDPDSDTWMQMANLTGPKRYDAVSFSIGTKGYIAAGMSGIISNNTDTFFGDLWEYTPGPAGINEYEKANVKFSPNPFSEFTIINIDKLNNRNLEFHLYDLNGKEVKRIKLDTQKNILNRENLESGVYVYMITKGVMVVNSGKLIINGR